MATIKAIEGRSVHQIQSGQVIVDLCSVAKELVENSIDAGATSIEVRFKNNGLDAIEVQDNGSGIAPADYDTIGLKHYTSKLSTYDDLTSLTTFGFRGEAISSLCALSKFHIVTARAEDGPKGTKLEFEQSGKLKGTSVVAAKQGTTIVVEQLFFNLPVRRKELEKTVKREYNKVLLLLNAYACISTGVKFSVSNQVLKGKKTVAFATQTNLNTKENIANVYGAKTLLALIPLDLKFEMDPSNRPNSTQSVRNWSTQEDSSKEVRIVGHISRPVVGEGRQTPDRQMFFVNSRPCLLPQVAKAFNEVYKSYNVTQSAFIFADLRLDTNAYDVNVSPDKRTILLHDQVALLENLKTALTDLFEGHDQSVPQAQLLGRKLPTLPAFRSPLVQARESTESIADDSRDSIDNGERSTAPKSKSREQDESSSPPPSSPSGGILRPAFVKASLIERFAGRDAEERLVSRSSKRRKTPIELDEDTLFVPEDKISETIAEQQDTLSESNFPEQESELPRPVQDFNARIVALGAERTGSETPLQPLIPGEDNNVQESIPVIEQTPQTRLSQSTIQNAFDRMRPMRTPTQQATITIGDTTTVSTIGSGSKSSRPKQIRVHTPKFSLDGKVLSQTPKRPLVSRSLRGFTAPGTQAEESDEEDEAEDQSAESDSSMPDAHVARSPSPGKRIMSKETIEISTGQMNNTSSEALEQLLPAIGNDDKDELPQSEPNGDDDNSDEEYIDESEKKAREDAKVVQMIAEAEEAAARPTEENLKRASKIFQHSRKKHTTLNLTRFIETSADRIARQIENLNSAIEESGSNQLGSNAPTNNQIDTSNPEERLSLTVTKSDFHKMRVIGQFNLGFILAVRPPSSTSATPDLFIIDQHASDEKYNFESFSSSTVLVSQRLVHPHPLELTAIEEELIHQNAHALSVNGFSISIDTETQAIGQRAKLTALPMSKEVTFTPTDLEELLALLLENPSSTSSSTTSLQYVPRPSKVRKLLASRACRASIMIGKTLKIAQMERVVRHMGEMDKPWTCPHGRPTMRHLYGLKGWDAWEEGDGLVGLGEGGKEREKGTDWGDYLEKVRLRRG
ncbi:DNA mismatch repair protein-like protein pms1 [Dendryphion nanum]|uniref:DNA mismatch repair protein PMS1 n=1 Tax=Dendryphion nanum TaxID=256645 RepID=A0A9P9IRG9_9PLEO|nr:DNA mismatch repair protein-like protein pms1 [Dendryphion nanum]